MVDFSNIFILFELLRSWLASLGINLPANQPLLLLIFLAAAGVLAVVGLLKKNRSDANRYNMKKFFLSAAGVFLLAAALTFLAPFLPSAMNLLSEKTGWSTAVLTNILFIGCGAVLLAILLPLAAIASKEANNSSLLNRRQNLFVWAALVGVLLAGYVFYAISHTTFTSALSVVLFAAECASILFWFYDPFVFITSRLITTKPRTSCPPTPHKLNRFAVLGCAHNEAAVIEQLIQSLHATIYPKNSYDIYVICDNCTDNTADVVRKAGAIAMERHDPEHRGKGFGLEWMFAKLDKERQKGNEYDAYIILDADNLVNENFLDEINYKMNEGYEILQAYLGCKNPTDTWVSRCYSYAYWVSDAQYQEAHSRVGLTAQMGGTGMVLRPKVLDEVGWQTDSLTEDLVLTSRYVLQTNRACCWVEKAKLYDEKPLKMKPSVKQRTRWMQGHMDAMFKYSGKLLLASIKNRSFKQFDMAFYLMRPLINLILVASYLVRLAFNLFAPHSPLAQAFIMGADTSTLLLIATVVLQGYLLFNEYYARYIHWFFLQMVFTFSWYPAIFRGLIKHKEKYWVSTVHTRSLAIGDVREDAMLLEAKERLRGLDNIHRLPLGQILLKAAVITRTQLDEALAIQKEQGGFLGDIIVKTKAITPETMEAYLSIQREMKEVAQAEGTGITTPRIGEILTDSGLITKSQLEAALAFQQQHDVLLGEAIIATRVLPLDLMKSFLDVQKVLDMNYVSRDSARHLINGLLAARTDNLGTILYSGGLISAQQLKIALEKQQQTGQYIGRTLVDLGFLTPQALSVILEFQADGRSYIESKAERDGSLPAKEGAEMSSVLLSTAVLYLAAFFFCLVIGMFIVPLVLERLTFYIPRLGRLIADGAVFKRSIVITAAEVLGWSAMVVAIYLFLCYTFPEVFTLVTTAWVAWVAWAIAAGRILYRFAFFGRTVKRDFYYSAYMHYITPEALHAYQIFIERLDDMDNAELEAYAALGKAIPYMHRQAIKRKMGERGIWDAWMNANQKISLFSLPNLHNGAQKK